MEEDPITETKFDETIAEYHPGAEIVVKENHYWLKGQRGIVKEDRGKLLEISIFLDQGKETVVLIPRLSIEPAGDS